ncbi:MAG: flagellar motor protein MotB [Thermodesulfovibrionia bacterium]|nr:flagellar motor protein MotB [Thermodesulfovibrionia bacterium]
MAKRKSKEEEADVMKWMVTFSDLITLLLTFFVLLLTMCSLEAGKVQQFQAACTDAMGVLLEGKFSEVQERIISSSNKHIDEQALKMENLLRQFSGIKTMLISKDKGGRLKFKELERGLSIVIRDDLLFGSGKSEINPEGISVLRDIGSKFENFEGRVIVEGHTDNVSISTEKFPSNWELSTGRAVSTVKYLTEELGVSPVVLSAAGYGDTKPRASNDTPDNRSKNRRIEIVLAPKF